MSLFGTKKNESKNGNRLRPTESARVNETTIVDLFVTDTGSLWGLSRVNELQGGRSFRTMKPSQLRDAAEALAFLAGVFAQDAECGEPLRSDLSELSRELQEVVDRLKNGVRAVNGETKPTGLLAAHL